MQNLDLIKEILLFAKKYPREILARNSWDEQIPKFSHLTYGDVERNSRMMKDQCLIECHFASNGVLYITLLPTGETFLNHARDEDAWNNAKTIAGNKSLNEFCSVLSTL